MDYQNELEFILDFFKNYHINTTVYTPDSDLSKFDLGLRKLLNQEDYYMTFHYALTHNLEGDHIYKTTDEFNCTYIFLQLQQTPTPVFLIIGPYMYQWLNNRPLMEYIKRYDVSTDVFSDILYLFQKIPAIPEDYSFQIILQTFTRRIWKDSKNFDLIILNYEESEDQKYFPLTSSPHSKGDSYYFQATQAFFSLENKLKDAVSRGQTLESYEILSKIQIALQSPTAKDSVEIFRSYSLFLNALLCKTLKLDTVNYEQIDTLFREYSQKFQQVTVLESFIRLQKEMTRKYCLAAKNCSIKQYSTLIQHTLGLIDNDLTKDLNLNTLATTLNVNASYLSFQFRKETGETLTEYVTKKRIEYAIFLLNTTSMTIQSIAQQCGISDVNYFSKLFKRYVSKTPSAYRKEIQKRAPLGAQ